ncbi:MAG: hypothetical protein WAO52_07855 [Prolixibacteraceae bacterium]
MKHKISLIALVFIFAISFTSCKKDSSVNSGSTSSDLNFKMQAFNKSVSLPVSTSGLKSASVTTATVVWDEATMLVSKVKFEAEMKSVLTGQDSLTIEYSWRGPRTIDLFDLNSTIGSITLPAGMYEEVSLKVNSEKEDANGLPLVYLSGNYTDAAGTILPIVISVSDPVSFKTEQKNDTIISDVATDLSSNIEIYLDQLMLQVDIAALDNATLTDGKIVISATINNELYQIIMQNLRRDHGCKYEHHHHD